MCLPFLGHADALREALSLEVADGVVVGVRQEIFNSCNEKWGKSVRNHANKHTHIVLTVFLNVPLQLVHQYRSVALQLLSTTDSTERDLSESLFGIRPIADSSNCSPVSYHGNRYVPVIKH